MKFYTLNEIICVTYSPAMKLTYYPELNNKELFVKCLWEQEKIKQSIPYKFPRTHLYSTKIIIC